jgi:deoxyribodipyrimidine photo-lyase
LGFSAPNAEAVKGRDVRLVHAWDLGDSLPRIPGELRVGVALSEFHGRWPWSAARWQFVGAGLLSNCDVLWWGCAAEVQTACTAAASVRGVADCHIDGLLPVFQKANKPVLLAPQPRLCASFSKFWTQATRGLNDASDLLA